MPRKSHLLWQVARLFTTRFRVFSGSHLGLGVACHAQEVKVLQAYANQCGGWVLDALKGVLLGALLPHLEEARAAVGGQRQLLQHNLLGHAHLLPQVHLHIWRQETPLWSVSRLWSFTQAACCVDLHLIKEQEVDG